jgi:prepilin-type N-terminal cleavage/methylation domain-containing protein
MNSRRFLSQRGFTLIEFGAAIAITGVLGLSVTQIARFNVLFLPAVQFGAAPSQCTADLKIFDNLGNTLASSTVTLLPNQSQTLSYQNAPSANGDPTAVELHALATVPDCPDNSESCSPSVRAQQLACANNPRDFNATLELADGTTGLTLVTLPGSFLPAVQLPSRLPGFGAQ